MSSMTALLEKPTAIPDEEGIISYILEIEAEPVEGEENDTLEMLAVAIFGKETD